MQYGGCSYKHVSFKFNVKASTQVNQKGLQWLIWTYNDTQYKHELWNEALPSQGNFKMESPCCTLKRKHESNIYEEKQYSLVNCKFPTQYNIGRHIAIISFHDANVTTLIKKWKREFWWHALNYSREFIGLIEKIENNLIWKNHWAWETYALEALNEEIMYCNSLTGLGFWCQVLKLFSPKILA